MTFRASSESDAFPASAVMDGNWITRWDSDRSDPQWVIVDFEEPIELVGLLIDWENAYAYRYMVQLSDDGKNWRTVFSTDSGNGGRDSIDFPRQSARYLRLYLQNRATAFGYSIFEVDLKTPEAPWGRHQTPHFFADAFERVGETDVYGQDYFVPDSWSNQTPYIQIARVPLPYKLYVNDQCILTGTQKMDVVELAEWLRFGTTNQFRAEGNGAGKELDGILVGADLELVAQSMNDLRRKFPKLYYDLQARIVPEGYFPYWLTRHQGYWTVVGVEEDTRESLFAQDGTLEPYKSFSIAPFVELDGNLITREDVVLGQELLDDFLPMPQVHWGHAKFGLNVQAFAWGEAGRSASYLEYQVTNSSADRIRGKVLLAIRPFEVNPPWQWGGLNRIDDLAQKQEGLITANEFSIQPLTKGYQFGVADPDEGDVVNLLANNRMPEKKALHHPQGQASGVIAYPFELKPGETATYRLAVPLHPNTLATNGYDSSFSACRNYWHDRLRIPDLSAPVNVINSLKANLAYILINRDGPAIQPGSRAYEASWIRDAAGTTKALLRCGYTNEVRSFIEWYSRWLFDDGRVPAIVIHNRNEVNPVKEYDSQGEFIAVVWNYYSFTKDYALLHSQWSNVVHALKYLVELRKSEEQEFYLQHEDQKRYYGILPKSVSHEGYYPEPGNHSYWDDFWGLKGWSDAIRMAGVLGKTNQVAGLLS